MLQKNWPAVDFRRFCIFILFMDSINYLCATVANVVKKFACGEPSPLLYFNFVQDFINYLCATVAKFVKNSLSPLLQFNFVHDSINNLCATVTDAVKKIRLRRAIG